MSQHISPQGFYSARLEHFTKRVKDSQSRLKRLALLRFGIFLATLILIFISTRWNFYVLGIIALTGTITFLLTINHYLSLQQDPEA